MNKQEKFSEDPLRHYINPEMREKAPEEFTNNVMMKISLKAEPVNVSSWLRSKNIIPIVSALVTILLVVAAFLLTDGKNDSSVLGFSDLFKKVNLLLPEINLRSAFSLNLPSVLIYISIGIFVLTLVDRALHEVFYKQK